MTALAPLPPEELARHWAEAEWRGPLARNPKAHEAETILSTCMAVCADAGDEPGLGFWRAVMTQVLLYDTAFQFSGEFPGLPDRPSLVEYLAMAIWDDGGGEPWDAADYAAYRGDRKGVEFFESFEEAYRRHSKRLWDELL